jgi:hypothetical protein
MASFEQTFLEQITTIQDVDFSTWEGWQALINWINRQPWRKDFLGGEKIPSRLLHPATLVETLTQYLGG